MNLASTTPGPAPARPAAVRACWMKCGSVVQGRGTLRVPFVEPVVVTPWDVAGREPAGPSLLATGRDLSPTGLSFSHGEPLPWRFVAVSFREGPSGADGRLHVETVLVRLIWCRFTRCRRYLSGGRIEGVVRDGFGQALSTLLGAG